jgi:hypothetical protein
MGSGPGAPDERAGETGLWSHDTPDVHLTL